MATLCLADHRRRLKAYEATHGDARRPLGSDARPRPAGHGAACGACLDETAHQVELTTPTPLPWHTAVIRGLGILYQEWRRLLRAPMTMVIFGVISVTGSLFFFGASHSAGVALATHVTVATGLYLGGVLVALPAVVRRKPGGRGPIVLMLGLLLSRGSRQRPRRALDRRPTKHLAFGDKALQIIEANPRYPAAKACRAAGLGGIAR